MRLFAAFTKIVGPAAVMLEGDGPSLQRSGRHDAGRARLPEVMGGPNDVMS